MRFGLLNDLPPSSGGLLGFGQPTADEEEAQRQQEEVASLQAEEQARQAALAQSDPLAPLPDTGQPQGLLQQQVANDQQPPDQGRPALEPKPLFDVREVTPEGHKPLVFDTTGKKGGFEVRDTSEEQAPTYNLLGQAKQRQELEARLAKEADKGPEYATTVRQAAYDDMLKEAVNGELWNASGKEMDDFAKRLATEVFDGEVRPRSDPSSRDYYDKIAEYRQKGGTLPAPLAKGEGKPGTKVQEDIAQFASGAASTVASLAGAGQAVEEATGLKTGMDFGTISKKYNALAQNLPQGTQLSDVDGLWSALKYAKQTTEQNTANLALTMSGGVLGGLVKGSVGAAIGAFGTSYPLELGTIENQNKQLDPDQKAGFATFLGAGAAATLDSVLPGKMGSQLIKSIGKEEAEKVAMKILLAPAKGRIAQMLGKGGEEIAKDAFTEGSTEAMQQAIEEFSTAVQTGKPIPDGLIQRMAEAGVAGVVLGGGTGAFAGAGHIRGEVKAGQQALGELQAMPYVATPTERAAQAFAPGRADTISGQPADLQAGKADAKPVAMTPEERAVQARPFLVRPTPKPTNPNGDGESFTLPNAPVTSKFGPRRTFRTANGQMASSNHAGVDIGLPAGANAPAGASGVVVSAGPHGGYGNQVVLQHSDGTTSSYSHLAKIGVKVGEEVAQGDSVGKVGKTGNATGPHLHVERRDIHGRPVNPQTGGIIQTSQDTATGEMADNTDYAADQTPVDHTADHPAPADLNAAYTEATGQQFDAQDFGPSEADLETQMAAEAAPPEPAPAAEAPVTRHEAASQALDEGGAIHPADTAQSVVASLDAAKEANPARQELIRDQAQAQPEAAPAEPITPQGPLGEAAPEAAPTDVGAPAATEGAADYGQPLAGEVPVFGQDANGAPTQEVVAFHNTNTNYTRRVGEPPAAAEPTPAAPSPETQALPLAPAAAPVTEAAPEPVATAEPAPAAPSAEQQAALDALPAVNNKDPGVATARTNGREVAMGLAKPPPLTSMTKSERTAFNVGLKEGKIALAKATTGKIVSVTSRVEVPPTTSAKEKGSIPAPAAVEQAQPETKQTEPAPIPPTPAKAPVRAKPAAKPVEDMAAKARRKDINKQFEKVVSRLDNMKIDDAPRGRIKLFAQKLVKDGHMDPSDFKSMEEMFKDKDMSADDLIPEIEGHVEAHKDAALAALSQPVTKARPSEEKPSEKTSEKAAPGPAAGTERGRPEVHDQDGKAGLQGTGGRTRPDLNKDGTYTLQHFGPEGLTETDPAMWGKSRSLSREERSYMAKAPPRTYFGLHTGEPGGYKKEFGHEVPGYEARIPADQMYDVHADPDKLWVRDYPEDGEWAIKNAGYTGYWYKNHELGLIGVVFDKTPVTRTEAKPAAEAKPEPKPEPKPYTPMLYQRKAQVSERSRLENPAPYPNAPPKTDPHTVEVYGHVKDDVVQAAARVLKNMGITARPDVTVQIMEKATARDLTGRDNAGEFERTQQGDLIIRIVALASHDASQTARHETIHYMRDTGIISPAEWRTLAAWAKNNKSLMAWAEANYQEENRDGIIEEAVAEGFARWHGGDPLMVRAASNPVKAIFDYLRASIHKLAVYLGGGGITRTQLNDAVRLMTDIQSGEQVRKFDAAKSPAKFKVTFGRKPIDVAISSSLMRGQITPEEAHALKVMDSLGVSKEQAVWHGSPLSTIERFLTKFIGTGEKAQAFGWGLYFAQKKSVADWYRVKLAMDQTKPADRIVTVNRQPISAFVTSKMGTNSDWAAAAYEVATRIHDYLTKGGTQYNGWIDSLHVAYDKEVPGALADADAENNEAERQQVLSDQTKVAQIFNQLRMRDVALDHGPAKGALYKAEIPDNEHLLDLDKTLGEQPPKVKEALKKVHDHLAKTGVLDDYEENLNANFWDWSGQELQMKVLKRMGYDDAFPRDVSPAVEQAIENGDAAKAGSLWLKDQGILGNRYLDRDSRDPTQIDRTHNFVIFDDAHIHILGKEEPVAMGKSMVKQRVVRNPQPTTSVLSDPTNPDPGLFRKIHDQTMAMLGKIGALGGKNESGDVDAADTIVDAFKRKVINRYQPVIKTLGRAAEALGGGRLPERLNTMDMITADERGYKMEHLLDNQVKPLAKFLSKSGINMSDLGLYLYARHAPARNARVAMENPEFRKSGKPGSGMSDAEAAKIMQDFAKAGKTNDLQTAAVYIDRMIEMAQQERLQSGLLTQDAIDKGFQPQDHYVPLRGNENIEPELEMGFPVRASGGGGFSVRGSESHPMYGRESKANLEQIVGYTITQAQEAIDRAYRNKVARSLHDLFQTVPDSNFVQIDRVKRVATWNEAKGQVEYQMQTRITDPEEVARTVFFKDGDTLHKMTFNQNNPSAMRFVRAIKNLDPVDIGRVGRLMGTFTKLWSRANTQWNVDFILANAAKDVQTGVLNAKTLNKKGLRTKMLANLASLGPLRGAWKGEFGKAGAGFAASDKWHKVYAEFEANGGKLHYGQVAQVDDVLKQMRTEFNQAKQANWDPRKAGRKTLELIDTINGAFENMTRLAAYKALRDLGVPAKEAAVGVRELTTNFQQHGEWGPKVNAFYGFANASIIGGARFGTTIAKSPLTLVGLLATGALSDLLNHWLDPDRWDQYTEEEKDAHFMLMMADWLGVDPKIPLGYGLNSFVTTGRKFSELWRGKKDKDGTKMSPLEAASNVGMSFANAFSPVGGATLANIVAPSITDPIVDVMQNKDNWGKPVYKQQYDDRKPDSQASFDKTSQFWKTMAEGMNAWTGGNEILKGYIDVHPETLSHIASEETGGATRSVFRAIDTGKKLATGQPISPNNIPIIRRFAGQPFGGGTADEQRLGTFYDKFFDAKNTVDQAKQMVTRYGVNSPEYKAFYGDHKKVIDEAAKIKIADRRLRGLKAGYTALDGGQTNSGGVTTKMQAAIFKASGKVVPTGRKLTEDQVATVKKQIDQRRLKLADEFNTVWKAEVLGAER